MKNEKLIGLTIVMLVGALLLGGCEKGDPVKQERTPEFYLELRSDLAMSSGQVPLKRAVTVALCVKPGDEHYLREHYTLTIDNQRDSLYLVLYDKGAEKPVYSLDSENSYLSLIESMPEGMLQRGYSEYTLFFVNTDSYNTIYTFRCKLSFDETGEEYWTDLYTMIRTTAGDKEGYYYRLYPGWIPEYPD